MSSLTWSADQVRALEIGAKIPSSLKSVWTMTGPAGSGKTSLMLEFIKMFEAKKIEVNVLAPTGKAALVIQKKTEHDASTIHSALYGGARKVDGRLIFERPREVCAPGGVVIVDESSMVGQKLYRDLNLKLPPRAHILYVGDKAQLEPVNDTWGPALDDADIQLVEVHRQALDNPILYCATEVRNGRPFRAWVPGRCEVSAGDPIEWYINRMDKDAVLLTCMNNVRHDMNAGIRENLGIAHELVAVGDRLVCLTNHKHTGVPNGETLTVTQVWPNGEDYLVLTQEYPGIEFELRSYLRGDSAKDSYYELTKRMKPHTILHWDYGYALTVHKSQGSQYTNVGFIRDSWYYRLKTSPQEKDTDFVRRLTYTAVTRAVESLTIF